MAENVDTAQVSMKAASTEGIGEKLNPPAPKPAKPPPKPKTPAKFAFHAIKIFDGVAVAFAVFIILIARFFRPGFWSTLLYALAGLPAGIAMSFLYFKRKREKRARRQLVRPCTVIEV
jgi:LPXTG-motif cell wall-anchored protein